MMNYGGGQGQMGGWAGSWPSWYGQPGYAPAFGQGGFAPWWGGGFGYGGGQQYGQFGPTPWQGYGTFPTPGFGTAPAFYGAMNDQELKDFVENAIDNDPAIPAQAMISVDARNGVVTLTGTVPNKRIKHAAGDDAWFVPQVTDVDNEIQVVPRRERGTRAGGETTTGGRRGTTSSNR